CVIHCAFFFSSRRRHTRSKRDWSSDVCSSDLASAWKSPARRSPRPGCPWQRPRTAPRSRRLRRRKRKSSSRFGAWTWAICCFFRSEERRVGKEERFVCEGYQDDELSDSI